MSNKPNIIFTALKLRCPNCGKGKLFVNPNAYNYKTMALMNDQCDHCGSSFSNREPGFYWGSMYVSYAISTSLIVFNLIWLFLIFGWNMWALIVPNVVMMIVMAPLNFRLSRAWWLGLNMRYFNKGQ